MGNRTESSAALAQRARGRRVKVRVEPEWAAEAVRLVLPRSAEAAADYARAAEPLYRLSAGERPAAFAELDALWAARLGLTGVVREAAAPFAAMLRGRELCVLRPAPPLEEGADLTHYDGAPAVRLALEPRRLLEPRAALAFCTHELQHVADMLDPEFAYDSSAPLPGATRGERELVRERFQVLWGASVDGRLRARALPALQPAGAWYALASRAFPRADEGALASLMETLSCGLRPTHSELLSRCSSAELGAPVGAGPGPGQPCPLCRFVTHVWAAAAELQLAADAIRADFPHWAAGQGACAQCIECYRPKKEETA